MDYGPEFPISQGLHDVQIFAVQSGFASALLERDDFSSSRDRALSFCLRMISAQTLRVCRMENRHQLFRILLQASVCTITGPAIAVAGPVSSGARSVSIHASARLLDSSAAA